MAADIPSENDLRFCSLYFFSSAFKEAKANYGSYKIIMKWGRVDDELQIWLFVHSTDI